jgi:transporter family-2 protein
LALTLIVSPIRFEELARAPWPELTGGPLGALVVVIMATCVRFIGVLRMSLGMIAGQTLGGLAIDGLVPEASTFVGAATVVGALLTLASAVIASSSHRNASHLSADRTSSRGATGV